MDAWYGLLALVAFIVAVKLYTWCQMLYWSSLEYMEDWKPSQMGQRQKYSVVDDNKERRDA
ncbi:MAG: hypothetical protein ABFD83_11160 [Armatimonadota bacterium]